MHDASSMFISIYLFFSINNFACKKKILAHLLSLLKHMNCCFEPFLLIKLTRYIFDQSAIASEVVILTSCLKALDTSLNLRNANIMEINL